MEPQAAYAAVRLPTITDERLPAITYARPPMRHVQLRLGRCATCGRWGVLDGESYVCLECRVKFKENARNAYRYTGSCGLNKERS